MAKGVRSTLPLKVVPGARQTCVAGWLGDALKVRVAAPPERGKANEAVKRLICEVLSLSSDSVRLVSGEFSQRKLVEIIGISQAELDRRLGRVASQAAVKGN